MPEYRENPDFASRGRHAQQRGSGGPSAQPPQGARRAPAAQPSRRPSGQPPARQQPPAQHPQAARRPQAARPGTYPPPSARPSANRPQGAPAGAYRPVQPVHGRGARPAAQKPKKRGPWRVVFWIALVVFVVAAVALGAIAFSYWQGQNAYDSVAEDVFAPPEDIEGTALADITVDWDKLKAMNPDTVGWVYIPGTPVNYPIVHTTDDEKYLATDFNGQQTWGATYGSIFLAAANAGDFSDANNIVYGHNLNNGSMFACIAGFEKAETFNERRTAYLLTPQGNFKLRTFSFVHVAADDPLAQTAFADDAERTAYFQDKIDRSVVAAADAPQAADIAHGFAFATCDNLPSDGRYVLYSYIEESTVPNVGAVGGSDAVDPEAVEAVDEAAQEAAA